MEIKAEIINPTETERMNFIVEYNHNKGFEIQEKNIELEDETKELHLQAWGYTEEEKQEQERERLAMLFLTGADVERGIYQAKGMDFDDIIAIVEHLSKGELDLETGEIINKSVDIDVKALKIELKANNFYRGNPYVNAVGSLLGFTPKQLDDFFETKDYHYLTNITLKINTTPSEAIVTINGKTTKEFSTPYRPNLQLPVTYSVACDGYATREDEMVLTENTVLDVVLEEEIVK